MTREQGQLNILEPFLTFFTMLTIIAVGIVITFVIYDKFFDKKNNKNNDINSN